ncbi:MAG: GAF domain-containing protein [Chloroflexi bacterium]|nr:GAF domain-containing protein [Chloroflexota bacterium]
MNDEPSDRLPDFSSFSLELEALYATAPIGLCVLDTKLRFLRINQWLAAINGFSVQAHLGRTVREMLPELADRVEPVLRNIIETGEARSNMEISGETPAQPGVTRFWREHFLPIKSDAGAVIALAVIVEEISERKRAEERFRLLNQAGELLSSSLDYESTLILVAQLAVPVIADWCVVDIADDAGALHRLAITHANPTKQGIAEELKRRYPVIPPDSDHTLNRVLRTGKTWFDPDVSAERFEAQARDPDHLRLLRELGFQSEIVVPLAARGKFLGGLTFVYGSSNRRYSAADVEMIEVLARRAALAIDNARLYHEAQLARQEADQHAARIALLQEITSALSSVRRMPELVEIILQRAVPLLDAHIGAILLLTEDGTALQWAEQSGLPPEVQNQYRLLPLHDRFPVTDVVRTQAPVWIETETEYITRYPHLMETIRYVSHTQAVAALPLWLNGKIGGVIAFGFPQSHPFDRKDRMLFAAIADQCAQAVDRIRLAEKERHLIVMEERQRLARELHDAVSQTLTAATIMAESADRIWKKDPQRALDIINQVARLNHVAQAELRTLLWELRPEVILKTKPSDLLSQLVRVVNERKGIRAELLCDGEDQLLPEAVHTALYRIAQESINNVFKHSQASLVRVYLSQSDGGFTLRVVDNGRGFDTGQTSAGLGLGTMRERAAAIGATLTLTSQPGAGTTIELSWSSITAGV